MCSIHGILLAIADRIRSRKWEPMLIMIGTDLAKRKRKTTAPTRGRCVQQQCNGDGVVRIRSPPAN